MPSLDEYPSFPGESGGYPYPKTLWITVETEKDSYWLHDVMTSIKTYKGKNESGETVIRLDARYSTGAVQGYGFTAIKAKCAKTLQDSKEKAESLVRFWYVQEYIYVRTDKLKWFKRRYVYREGDAYEYRAVEHGGYWTLESGKKLTAEELQERCASSKVS